MCVLAYVADNEALRMLDLSWNHIRKKGAVAVATSLKVCTTSFYIYGIRIIIIIQVQVHKILQALT